MTERTVGDLYALLESMARQQGWLPDDELREAARVAELARRAGQEPPVYLSQTQLAIGQRLVAEHDEAARAAQEKVRAARHEAALASYHLELTDAIPQRLETLSREIAVDRSRGGDTTAAEGEVAELRRLSGLPADELRRETASVVHMRLLGLDGDGTALARLMNAVGPYPMVSDTHPVREEV